MYCSKCGYKMEDGTNFCRKCGSKNIFNNLVPNEKKIIIDSDTSSKEINTKEDSTKKINNKQTKHKGFIILGILILLVSVGFASYYVSVSKFFSDAPKKSDEKTSKDKAIPTDTSPKKVTIIKPTIDASADKPDISNMDSPAYYFFPNSKSEKLIESDISKMTKENLSLARNEIYARHGLVFKGEFFKNYFNKKSWYKPNPNFKESNGELTPVEMYNIQFILKYEKS